MAQRLKDIYLTRASIDAFGGALARAYPPFDTPGFLKNVFGPGWKTLELKDRMHHVARTLRDFLPPDYAEALHVLREVAPTLKGFEAMALPDFVEMFGRFDRKNSLPALGYFTKFGSSEFAIRPFILDDAEGTMAYMKSWAKDPDPMVRRLASEGCRPRLPWAMALPAFKKDPSPIIPILEILKDDKSEMVRRSVANNLNDIAKDNPGVLLEVAKRWSGASPQTDALLKHACRGLLKKGNREAMKIFGFHPPEGVKVRSLRFSPPRVNIGDKMVIALSLRLDGKKGTKVRIEYAIDYVRSGGKTSRKIFQWSERVFEPGTHALRTARSFKDFSTRKHYPGKHRFTVFVNGTKGTAASFELISPKRGASATRRKHPRG
jgi:3-methyladenine DNA glycosylase AlkC